MIEIISHPGPDRSVTMEGLRTFKVRSRRYRNRRIGEFLKELHLTEGRNTGFNKILNALKKNGSPLPEFETNDAHDYFITRLFIRSGFLNPTHSEGIEPSIDRSFDRSFDRSLSVFDSRTMGKLRPIIKYLQENDGITPETAKKLVKKSERTSRRYLNLLVNAGILKPVGNTNNVMYLLTGNSTNYAAEYGNSVVYDGKDSATAQNISNTSEELRMNFGGTSEELWKKYEDKVSPTQLEIIKILFNKSNATAQEIASQIGLSSRSIESNIKQLKEKAILIRHGTNKGGYWEINRELQKNDLRR